MLPLLLRGGECLLARFEIKKGVAKVAKFETVSKDGELFIDFEAKLEKVLNNSQVAGCLRFKPSESLEQRDYRTALQLKTTGAPLGPDNLFHIKLQGPMREIKRLGVVCGPGAAAAGGAAGGAGAGSAGRPSLPVPAPDQPQPLPNLPVATPPAEVPPPPIPPPTSTPPPQPAPAEPPPPAPSTGLAPPPATEVPPPPPVTPAAPPGVIE